MQYDIDYDFNNNLVIIKCLSKSPEDKFNKEYNLKEYQDHIGGMESFIRLKLIEQKNT